MPFLYTPKEMSNYQMAEFLSSLREDQIKDYHKMSVNQKKNWYITWLENQRLTLIEKLQKLQNK